MDQKKPFELDTNLYTTPPETSGTGGSSASGGTPPPPPDSIERLRMEFSNGQPTSRQRRQRWELRKAQNPTVLVDDKIDPPSPPEMPTPIKGLREFPILVKGLLTDVDQAYQGFDVKLISSHDTSSNVEPLYLFHVIVALEWQPSEATITTLMHGLRGASDFLYDATNGCMAFGQVTFCGPEYMAAADIQIMASNRFHPRSMVNGLHDDDKFFPIRVGRGVWHKNNRVLIPWDEPVAFRAIAHEWAHYALGLHDEYVDDNKRVVKQLYRLIDVQNQLATSGMQQDEIGLVVPRFRLSIESMMATLDVSEIGLLQATVKRRTLEENTKQENAQADLDKFLSAFPALEEPASQTVAVGASTAVPGKQLQQKLIAPNSGPHRFPSSLPQFCYTDQFAWDGSRAQEILLDVNNVKDASGHKLNHCWLYTVKWQDEARKALTHVIAQGSIDARARGVDDQRVARSTLNAGQRLLGAGFEDGEEVLAIGLNTEGFVIWHEQLTEITVDSPADTSDATSRARLAQASYATSDATPWARLAQAPKPVTQPPVVAVLPSPNIEWPDVEVRVRLFEEPQHTDSWIAVPGTKPVSAPLGDSSYATQHLDGVVVLKWQAQADNQDQADNQEQERLWVAEYSHGGNPPTSVRIPGAPISAGSADGNLMIFSKTDSTKDEDYKTRIVTTRNYGGFEDRNPYGSTPCSYLFSVASNVEIESGLHPTIILYYDLDVLQLGGDLVIFRYDEQAERWRPVPTYLPPGGFYAATPMNEESAPNLTRNEIAPDNRVEFYRLFAVPRR